VDGTFRDDGGAGKRVGNFFQNRERQTSYDESGVWCEGRTERLLKEIMSEGVAWIKLV